MAAQSRIRIERLNLFEESAVCKAAPSWQASNQLEREKMKMGTWGVCLGWMMGDESERAREREVMRGDERIVDTT